MSIFGKTRTFIVEEKDVTKILDLINEQRKTTDFTVGNCGWAENSTKWFVEFDSTDKVYNRIVKQIEEIGKINLSCGAGTRAELYVQIES